MRCEMQQQRSKLTMKLEPYGKPIPCPFKYVRHPIRWRKEMWNLVEEGILIAPIGTGPANDALRKSVEEVKLKDLKVKTFLYQAIEREIFEIIFDKSTSKSIWDSMNKSKGSTKVKRAQLHLNKNEIKEY
nr:retrovirus-related Pol polyprotein from transposon TNT 1-94 [Tanacetum cinerariifolium]